MHIEELSTAVGMKNTRVLIAGYAEDNVVQLVAGVTLELDWHSPVVAHVHIGDCEDILSTASRGDFSSEQVGREDLTRVLHSDRRRNRLLPVTLGHLFAERADAAWQCELAGSKAGLLSVGVVQLLNM
jgi:hypothetical protein